jgi:N,N'-diacetyllegionaminate synthase
MLEIDAIVNKLKESATPFIVMQCTTSYPCPPEKIGLNMISLYRERYQSYVGFSDHSGTIYAGLAATTIGIEALEIHVTLSREMFGPDVVASITTAELRQLVEGIRFIERIQAYDVDKNKMAAELLSIRNMFTKSVVAATNLTAGTVLQQEHLGLKKPGAGIPADKINSLLGKRLIRDLVSDELINWNDLENESPIIE